LLEAIDERLGLSEQLANYLRDGRRAGKVRRDLSELLQQRLFAIALGRPNGNDAGELADDPILAAQPTFMRSAGWGVGAIGSEETPRR